MTDLTPTLKNQLLDLAQLGERQRDASNTPMRVGQRAFASFDQQLSDALHCLEAEFGEFITNDSLGNSIGRDR